MPRTRLYEWNYARQMLELRLVEATGGATRDEVLADLFGPDFLIRRPLLQAIDHGDETAPVLLIDEIDRADDEFEAFLLELLSDFQVTVPEIGTITTDKPPTVVITSNRTREIHDALKRRCLYQWIDYPTFAKEFQIVTTKVPEAHNAARGTGLRLRAGVARRRAVQAPRRGGNARLGARPRAAWQRATGRSDD